MLARILLAVAACVLIVGAALWYHKRMGTSGEIDGERKWTGTPLSGVAIKRDDLVGTWKLVGTRLPGQQPMPVNLESVMRLDPDGTAELRNTNRFGAVGVERATWEYVDERHWKLKLVIPPAPIPTLEHGAVGVSDYEVQSFRDGRMELTKFDYEFAFVYERVR